MPKSLTISIIVPVYNVELYIERCLISLIEQDVPVKDYEIIVINDGSNDKSCDIILELKQSYPNIRLINQENKGVSMARNAGLEMAEGRYILFIDSDDYIEKNCLAGFIEIADRDKLDVLYMGFEEWSLAGAYNGRNFYKQLNGEIINGVKAYQETRGKNFFVPDRSHAILFNHFFLKSNSLKFTPEIPFLEDGLFVGKVLCLANRCGFNDTPFYKYNKRLGSASENFNRKDLKKLNGFIIAANDLKTFLYSNQLNTDQKTLVNNLIAKYVIIASLSAIGSRNIKTIKVVKATLNNNGFRSLKTDGLNELKLNAKMYNISFWLFCLCFVIKTKIGNVKHSNSK